MSTDRQEAALSYFAQGYNCAQSTLLPFTDLADIDVQTAMNIAGGCGSGCGTGELCGAINGSIMALGLANPIDQADPRGSKKRTMKCAQQLQQRFRETFGSVRCRDLLANEGSFDPADFSPAMAMGLSSYCQVLVAEAVELTEQILAEAEGETPAKSEPVAG